MERWLPVTIKGKQSNYEISSMGRVRNRHTGIEIQPFRNYNRNGMVYIRIQLTLNDRRVKFYLHRLVATIFIRPPEIGEEVDHMNVDTTDNRPINLQWVTRQQNQALVHARMAEVESAMWAEAA